MSNFIKRALGIVYVEEDETDVEIGGVSTGTIAQDLMRLWTTSKIERNMFSEFSGRHIRFAKFFAPDVHYMLQQILRAKRKATSESALRLAIKALEENSWLKRLQEETPDILDRSKLSLFRYTPLEHQEEFFKLYNRKVPQYGLTGYLLSAAAGSGKTLMDLMLAEMLHASVVPIVCPKNAVYRVWVKSLKEEFKNPQDCWVASDNKPYEGQKYLIAHYEALDQLVALVGKMDKKFSVVVLDESHNLNNDEALRTQLFLQLCKAVDAKHVIWASGTPIKALGGESIPLLRSIDPLFTAEVEKRFRAIFGRESSRALDVLRNRMGLISFRVEKDEVRTLPKPASHTVQVKIPNGKDYTLDTIREEMRAFIEERLKFYEKNMGKFERFYADVLDEFEDTLKTKQDWEQYKLYKSYIAMIRKGYDPKTMVTEAKFCNVYELKVIMPTLEQPRRNEFKSVRSIIKYPQLKVMGEALGGILGRKRVKCHLDMIPHVPFEEIINEATKKTLIFTNYVEVADGIAKYLSTKGFKPVVVHGTAAGDLTSSVAKFEKDPDLNPMVATYKSLSTAVPLIMANATIFMDATFRDHEMTQAKARTDRLGQDSAVDFYSVYLDTGKEPNISTRSKDILEWSRAQVGAILGTDYSGEVVNLGDVGVSMEQHHETIYQLAMESFFELN